MIIRDLEKIIGTKRQVNAKNGNWISRRLILKDDNVGFSLTDTIINEGTQTHIWYKNHVEAVYCIEGEGELELEQTGEKTALYPGLMYLLNCHEKHILRAKTRMRMICVFNPPLTGSETHDDDGSYPLTE